MPPSPPGIRPTLAHRLAQPFTRFAELEVSSAVVLLIMTALALAWANSPWGETYETFWHHTYAGVKFGEWFELSLPLGHWVNDALMAVFFFVVGMEIKREMAVGELSTLRPGAAADLRRPRRNGRSRSHLRQGTTAGGPASAGLGRSDGHRHRLRGGCALGARQPRVPHSLRIFLLALAIVDDLGAVAVIAVFYTAEIHLDALALGGRGAGHVRRAAQRDRGALDSSSTSLVGAFVWYETHHSGVHATIAGVLLGFLAPTTPDVDDHSSLLDQGRDALERLRQLVTGGPDQHGDHGGHGRHAALRQLLLVGQRSLSPLDFLMNTLERWVAFFVMPLFALANAGVVIDASTFGDPTGQRVGIAVALGLLLGKPLGIALFSWVAVRVGIAVLPRGVNWRAILATGVLAGIGFTVALFVTALAFTDPTAVAGAKLGILAGSLVATILGLAILLQALPPTESPSRD